MYHDMLDNIAWHTLAGPQAHFSEGHDRARRYARGFSPLAAFPDRHAPDFGALATLFEPGETFYLPDVDVAPPSGWQVDFDATMYRMYCDGAPPATDEAPDAVPLGPEHATQALELALLTNPGPFGLRTLELGEYFGYFEGPRLIAMAGERMGAGPYREVSGVCTHPDFQGRGLARRLTARIVLRQRQRGQVCFLQVMRGNDAAHGLYERLGFRIYREIPVRVMSRTG